MRRERSIYLVSTALVCGVMVFSAVNFNLANPLGPMKGAFVHLGYPSYFRIELTIAKALGVLAILIPRIPFKVKEFAYFGFGITLISASIAHFSIGDSIMFVIDPLLFLAALATSYVYFIKFHRAPRELPSTDRAAYPGSSRGTRCENTRARRTSEVGLEIVNHPAGHAHQVTAFVRALERLDGSLAAHQSRHTEGLSENLIATPRDAWAQWISPETLISQVQSTAPFLEAQLPQPESGRLIELGGSPDGFRRILASWRNILRPSLTPDEQLQDYFTLCMACHHATVATFVPTDVDTKIRGIVWRESRDPDVLRPMLRLALNSRLWTEDGISIRAIRGVSGHNGEQWSAIAGGLGRLLEIGDLASAEEAQAAIETEIDREQTVFDEVAAERDAELDLLRLSMTLAHNRGDLTQGMGFWKKTPVTAPLMERLSARGRFSLAVRIYQHTGLSAEGHRHYPLRPVKVLRRSPVTLLPLCPFLDEWGGVVAQLQESHEVLAALVVGCQKVQGQQGYYRAIAGMRAASSSAFDRAAARMSNGEQRLLRGAEMRRLIDVPRISFESMMKKRARTALALFSRAETA